MKKDKLLIASSALLMLLILACIVSLVLLSVCGINHEIFKEKNAPKPQTEVSSVELGETVEYGSHYLNSIVFVTDKRLSGIDAHGIAKTHIWTQKDGDLPLDFNTSTAHIVFPYTNEEISVPDATGETKPEYMIVSLGFSNGIRCSEEKFKEYYTKLISNVKSVSPNTKIILQSILPISKNYEKDNSGITNEKIDTANSWIHSIARENGVKYLNTASVLKDSMGQLSAEYDSGDGITLNPLGYQNIIEYIRTHGYK